MKVSKAARARISDRLYGIFLEDINYGGDGGLYAELVPNRAFEFVGPDGADNRLMRWQALCGAQLEIACEAPRGDRNPHYARITPVNGVGALRSEGYLGHGFYAEPDERYRLSVIARAERPGHVHARIVGESGTVLAQQDMPVGDNWNKRTLELAPNTAGERAYLELEVEARTDFDFISLFPVHTFKNRENGARIDIAQALCDLKPAFMRFPGGCIVEGRSFDNMYRWKDTLGPVEERRVNWNRWQLDEYQIDGRHSYDYYQSYGMGYYEYMQFCEDIGCLALPVLNCGLTCQWHEALAIPLDEMDGIISDYIDFIEFCNGDVNTRWGSERARMGHPAPFGLKMIGVGNEQWDDVYFERYEAIHRAVKAVHPEIELIGCAGWRDDGWEIDKAHAWMKRTDCKPDYSDEHFYKPTEWFIANTKRYIDYDKALPRVFAGEYAAHTDPNTAKRRNNMYTALAEAAFMTGLENASPNVAMACYAPLLARYGANQWQPDLIWFDQHRCVLTPNYHVQRMFANARGDELLKVDDLEAGLYVTASRRECDKAIIIKVVNPGDDAISSALELPIVRGDAHVVTLSGQLEAENSIDAPDNVCPCENAVAFEGALELKFKPHSVNVITVLGE